jgi:DNA-binding transcriptional regulator YbjK
MQNKNKPRKQDISNSQSTRIEELLERWIATFHANKGQGMGTG